MHKNFSRIWQEDLASSKKVAPVYFFFSVYFMFYHVVVFILELKFRGGTRNFPTEGLELPTGGWGAKMNEKWSFRTIFCQISSDEKLKFPPTVG